MISPNLGQKYAEVSRNRLLVISYDRFLEMIAR